MDREQAALWERISGFSFDDSQSSFRFSDRLGRENQWTRQFTLAVIEEYRRFLFLACVADHQVTPSREVDEAWHLHMIYTRSYWNDLCAETLGRKIHHGPTKGGRTEDVRYDLQYRKTLASYRDYFGHEAPHQIWPEPSERFRPEFNAVRIDTSRHWIIRKPRFINRIITELVAVRGQLRRVLEGRSSIGFRLIIPFFVIYLVLSEHAVAGSEEQVRAQVFPNPITTFDGPTFLVFYPLLAVGLLVTTHIIFESLLSRKGRSGDLEEESEGADTIAVIAEELGHHNRLGLLSIARLLSESRIAYQEDKGACGYKPGNNPRAPTKAIDLVTFRAIQHAHSANLALSHHELLQAINVSPQKREIKDRLEIGNVFRFPAQYSRARALALALYLAFLSVGISRVGVGLHRGRPVGFLLAEIVVLSIVFFVFNRKGRLQSYYTIGGRFFKQIEQTSRPNRDDFPLNSAIMAEQFWKNVAVLGFGALPTTGMYAELFNRFNPPQSGNNGSGGCGGGGSSDGGGGGGGGCGGCGGCGGD